MDSKANHQEFLLYLLPILHSSSANLWLPAAVLLLALAIAVAAVRWSSRGGHAWGGGDRSSTIPGPRGLPLVGSLLEMGGLAHRRLQDLAAAHAATRLMALSLGSTRLIVASVPEVAKEILSSAAFADRPLKQSAAELLFGRAIGFAPYGHYWRSLRRIAANHLFSPRRIAAHEPRRQRHAAEMTAAIAAASHGGAAPVAVRGFLQRASLRNVMESVFGRRYGGDGSGDEAALEGMVKEGFELLGAFNWSDHLPLLRALGMDPHGIQERCAKLVPKVQSFVQRIIDEHRAARSGGDGGGGDFVDVLLNLSGEEKLQDEDMIAVLWEMIFRGTDTTAILTEWIIAELVLHPGIQRRLHSEIEQLKSATNPPSFSLSDADVARMPLLQAVIKETLRLHPPGPLLSWARLSTEDVTIAGHHVPRGTTAMVNMWAITHDAAVWSEPEVFNPDRFLGAEVPHDFDVKGTDLRLAPFGAGRRVCPGRALGMATVGLWVAKMVERFELVEDAETGVDLSEVLKLSCEMVNPLRARVVEREGWIRQQLEVEL